MLNSGENNSGNKLWLNPEENRTILEKTNCVTFLKETEIKQAVQKLGISRRFKSPEMLRAIYFMLAAP